MHSTLFRTLSWSALILAAACSSKSSSSGPPIPARVPPGSGNVTIQMIGTWEIRDAIVIESNAANPTPPANGTLVTIDATGVAALAGLSTRRADLEALLGFPLDSYFNSVDGRTVLYGLAYDRRSAGGNRQVVGVAGGAVNDVTILVESFTSNQGPTDAEPVNVRARYTLVRVASSIVLPAALEEGLHAPEPARVAAALHAGFGGR